MASLLVEVIGWIGAALVVLAYYMITHGLVGRKSPSFHLLNFAGSVLLGINAYINQALPSFGINVIWILIALYGFWIIFRKNDE